MHDIKDLCFNRIVFFLSGLLNIAICGKLYPQTAEIQAPNAGVIRQAGDT